jgi:hypothetical protein
VALQRLQAANATIQLEGTRTALSIEPGEATPSRTVIFAISYAVNGAHEKLVQIHKGGLTKTPTGFERVFVTDHKNDFTLQRDSEDQSYRLIGRNDDVRSFIDSKKMLFVDAPYSIGGILLPNIMKSPNFSVRKLSWQTHDGQSLLRVDINYTSGKPNVYTMSGWMLVDPQRNWGLREYNAQLAYPSYPGVRVIYSGTVRYRENDSTLPEEVTFSSTDTSGKSPEGRDLFRLKSFSFDPLPEEGFSLAAFGLGDVDRPSRRSRHGITAWAFCIALFSIVLGIVLKRLGGARGSRS